MMEELTYLTADSGIHAEELVDLDDATAEEAPVQQRLFGPFNYTKDIIDAIVEMTQVIPLFDNFDPMQLRVIVSHMQIIRLEAGECLFTEGEEGDETGFIVSGRVKVFKQTHGGQHALVSTLSRGRSIGEMAMIDSYCRSATAITSEATTMLTLKRKHFEQIVAVDSQTGFAFMKALARVVCLHLRRTSNQYADACETVGEVTDDSCLMEAMVSGSTERAQLETMAAGRVA
ncbi:cyclic nucleotide-binding domain-containing protein [Mariprofundus sp. NF]|jgi:CRP-like cAMP-binding protein|uniref:cyclic nucleotide-binding domain-containing protein n=1 Tax=Mariprofundus sp. NF TaxID=2608716 RepID=UPI001F5150F4|nr:cyclic nucleotide-binding domain-containing protein [Mariprofundus sp. NF]